jgi:hypothetical protein
MGWCLGRKLGRISDYGMSNIANCGKFGMFVPVAAYQSWSRWGASSDLT